MSAGRAGRASAPVLRVMDIDSLDPSEIADNLLSRWSLETVLHHVAKAAEDRGLRAGERAPDLGRRWSLASEAVLLAANAVSGVDLENDEAPAAMSDAAKLALINDHRTANGRHPLSTVRPPATLDSELDRIHELAQHGVDPFADEDA